MQHPQRREPDPETVPETSWGVGADYSSYGGTCCPRCGGWYSIESSVPPRKEHAKLLCYDELVERFAWLT